MQPLHLKIVAVNIVPCLLSQNRVQKPRHQIHRWIEVVVLAIDLLTKWISCHRSVQIAWIIPSEVVPTVRVHWTIQPETNDRCRMILVHSWMPPSIQLISMAVMDLAPTKFNSASFAVRPLIKINCGDYLTLCLVSNIVILPATVDEIQTVPLSLIALSKRHNMLGKKMTEFNLGRKI